MPQDDFIPIHTVNERFDRIERKIDKLSDILISLARTEERMNSIELAQSSTLERVDRHAEKLDMLSSATRDNTRVVANITKLTWLSVTSLAGVLLKLFVFI